MNSIGPRSFGVIKRFLPLLILVLFSVFVVRMMRDQTCAQSEYGLNRKLKVKGFKDMPLEITAIRNLESDDWVDELRIDVKNTGTKPIYFIYGHISPTDDGIGNDEVSVSFFFGKFENLDIKRLAEPTDPHLNPKETFTYSVAETEREGARNQYKRFRHLYNHLVLEIHQISFGDGTGIDGSGNIDERHKAFKPQD